MAMESVGRSVGRSIKRGTARTHARLSLSPYLRMTIHTNVKSSGRIPPQTSSTSHVTVRSAAAKKKSRNAYICEAHGHTRVEIVIIYPSIHPSPCTYLSSLLAALSIKSKTSSATVLASGSALFGQSMSVRPSHDSNSDCAVSR